jgi:hypothetical protein
MRVKAGDRLVTGPERAQVGLIIGVPGDGGQPPYVVRWLGDGHVALVFPDEYAQIIPAGDPAGSDTGDES